MRGESPDELKRAWNGPWDRLIETRCQANELAHLLIQVSVRKILPDYVFGPDAMSAVSHEIGVETFCRRPYFPFLFHETRRIDQSPVHIKQARNEVETQQLRSQHSCDSTQADR